MAVQFENYRGGPHGGSPVVLPQKINSTLGDVGQFANQIGQIPGEMQQADIKTQLNNLLLQVLGTPQTIKQTTPGVQIPFNSTSGAGAGIDPNGVELPPGGSYGSMMTDPVTKDVPNPAYENSLSRLTQVGPAFGMKFPTPIENIYAAAMARSLGATETEKVRQQGRTELETQKQGGRETLQDTRGDQKLEQIGATGEVRSSIEDQRQTNRQKLLTDNITSREKIATDHNISREKIANNNNLTDAQKTKDILAERSAHHKESEANYAERTKAIRSTTNNLDEIRVLQQINAFQDNLTAARTQIDKIRQLEQTDPSVQAELKTSVEQYNTTVDRIKALDPQSNLSKYTADDTEGGVKNFLRSMTQGIIPGVGSPTRSLQTTPNTTPAQKPAGTSAVPKTNTPAASTSSTTTMKPADFPTYDAYLDALRKKYSGGK